MPLPTICSSVIRSCCHSRESLFKALVVLQVLECFSVLQCVAVCCSVCCSAWQCIVVCVALRTVCCSACCSAWQCVMHCSRRVNQSHTTTHCNTHYNTLHCNTHYNTITHCHALQHICPSREDFFKALLVLQVVVCCSVLQ